MVIIYKNEGETPLECLGRLRVEQPEYKDAVLSYAGRLDPMAEGALLVLVGEENKEREKYLGLDKEYEVEVLLGVGTDTGDILGVCNVYKDSLGTKTVFVDIASSQEILQSFVGPFTQTYPHFSSKTVDGKPLFQWAREGRLDEIEIPTKEVEIYSIELLKTFTMTAEEILQKVKERIVKVKGDFRQEECLVSWQKWYKDSLGTKTVFVKIKVSCSSGTYMRSLGESIGKKYGQPAMAWKIVRTAIGH